MSQPKRVTAEEMKRAAYGAYCLLKDNLPKRFIPTDEREDYFIIEALTRHGIHLSTHAINQEHADPLKLLCWFGGAIIAGIEDAKYEGHEEVLTALINSLEETLMLETGFYIRLTPDNRNILHRMAMAEIRGQCEHGIGFNGLLVAFHGMRAAYLSLRTTLDFPPLAG